jgi:hypothetical protein
MEMKGGRRRERREGEDRKMERGHGRRVRAGKIGGEVFGKDRVGRR